MGCAQQHRRFPELQIVPAENDVSWLYHFMYRLDHAYERFRHLQRVTLSMLPSEYVKRQLHASFQFEEVGMDLINRFGAENLLWSSDYPHTDSTWPHSREFIDAHFKGIPGDVTAQIVGANAARLYHLD
jgi:predicted TIM-barrel fold metal-dependent hydrolase